MDAITGARGPAAALAAVLGGLLVLLLFLFPGMMWLPLVLREPSELFRRIWSFESEGLIFLVPLLAGTGTVLWYCRFRARADQPIRTIIIAATLFYCIPAVLLGASVWIMSREFGAMASVLIQAALLFSLLWFARVLLPLLSLLLKHPKAGLLGTMRGFGGAAIAAVSASLIAHLRGADFDRIDSIHAFYIWTVPALAGFGWTVPRPQSRSWAFAGGIGVLILAMAWYAVPIHFMEPPRIECDYSYERPRHNAYGFENEPWRWKAYKPWYWTAAPGSFAELTLRHIAQPLIGFTCNHQGDVPAELDQYNAFEF